MIKNLLLIVIIVGGGYYYWTTRPITHGPGEVAPEEPVQKRAFGIDDITFDEYRLTPLAEIKMQARVLSKKRYFTDKRSEAIPYDIVFGWGPMSDERNLAHILIKQSDRYFHWETTKPPISEYQMRSNSANMHLIPSNKVIEEKLADIRDGHIVKLKGYLVKISSRDGWILRSSLTRDDVGKFASEVLWIESMEVL